MKDLDNIEVQNHFASDNNSGVIPEVMDALVKINKGHVASYGADPFTGLANQEIERLFGNVDIYYVFNGTAANVVALKSAIQSYHAVICSDISHLQNDECGAPEANIGCKLLLCPTQDGKLTVKNIQEQMVRLGDTHHIQAKIVSVTQPTEYGTCYTLDELKNISEFAKKNNLLLHMDGSRLVNAAEYLRCGLKQMTTDLGFDLVSFGGTKNGLLGGEVILSFNPDFKEKLRYLRKQGMQLAGKMRFLSGQFYAWLQQDTYQKYAKHSHHMALMLADKLRQIEGIEINQKVESNAVFVKFPKSVCKELKKHYFFYIWNQSTWEARLMTSFDTTKGDIENFTSLVQKLMT